MARLCSKPGVVLIPRSLQTQHKNTGQVYSREKFKWLFTQKSEDFDLCIYGRCLAVVEDEEKHLKNMLREENQLQRDHFMLGHIKPYLPQHYPEPSTVLVQRTRVIIEYRIIKDHIPDWQFPHLSDSFFPCSAEFLLKHCKGGPC